MTNDKSPQKKSRLKPAERHAQIAEAARELSIREGLGAVTLRGVAKELSVASGLVAHYESSMEALVASTFAAVAAGELTEIQRDVETGAEAGTSAGTPTARLAHLIETLLDAGRDDVSSVWADAWSLGRRMPQLAAAARQEMDAWHRVATRILDDGLADGSFTTDSTERVALQIFALIDSTTAYALVGYSTPAALSEMVLRSIESALGLSSGSLDSAAA